MLQRVKYLIFKCDHEIKLEDGTATVCERERWLPGGDPKKSREEGWALGADKKCYCPEHAPFYRNVGRTGKPRAYIQTKLEETDGRG